MRQTLGDRASAPESVLTTEPGGRTRLEAVLAAVAAGAGGRPPGEVAILEVGCGRGGIAVPLARRGHPVLGLDIDPASIDQARQAAAGIPTARFEAADLLVHPVSLRFPMAVASEVLEHLTDPGAMLERLHDILEPGGMLVVTVPAGHGPWEQMNRAKRLLAALGLARPLVALQRSLGYTGRSVQSASHHLDHVQFFTPGSMGRLLARTGFRVESWENLSFMVTVFPVSWLWRRLGFLETLDATLAGWLPRWIVSGWIIRARRMPDPG